MKDPETIEDKVGNKPPSKRFWRNFRNKKKKTKSTEEFQDTYLVDAEYGLAKRFKRVGEFLRV